MLSNTSRWLTYLLSFPYAILGFPLFSFSAQLVPVFAWKVTPFMAATMGGWCIGNAWSSFITARRWEWMFVSPSLVYVWVFGISELIVVLVFRDKLLVGDLTMLTFSAHPGQLSYGGAYFLIGIPLTRAIIKEGTGIPR